MKYFIFLLSYAVVVLGIFSVDTSSSNKLLERTVHAQYTEKLTDASEKLSYLQRSVSQSLLFQDEAALTTELDNIWRLSSEIRTSIASLPLKDELSNEWMSYLGKIGDQAKQTAQTRDYASWRDKMSNVSSNLKELSNEWAVATTVYYQYDGNVNAWESEAADVETDKKLSNVSSILKDYKESDFPLTQSESDWQKKQELKELNDQEISQKEAITNLQTLLPTLKDATMAVSKSKKDAPYPFYHLQFHEGIRLGYADVTKKGGHLLSFLMERPVDNPVMTQEQIYSKAQQYLENMKIDDVEFVESRENHQAWHLTYARVNPENNALIYGDAIQLKLAKDNGELLGLNAMEYIQKENVKEQVQNPIDWKEFFTSDIQVQEERLIYTDNGQFEQRLCYEVLAVKKDSTEETFRVVVDTENHQVLKVEYLT